MAIGPVIIGYHGSESSDLALRRAAELLAPRPALVVVVWEADDGFEVGMLPTNSLGLLPAPLDFRRAMELDEETYEHAQRLAQRGADLAQELGLDAAALAVADDLTVGDTLIRLATERDSQAVVVGAHGHSALEEVLLGRTAHVVVQRAPCPVVVVRKHDTGSH